MIKAWADSVSGEPTYWFIDGVPPHPLLVDGTLLIRAQILFMGPPASRPNQATAAFCECHMHLGRQMSSQSRIGSLPAQKEGSFSRGNDIGDQHEVWLD